MGFKTYVDLTEGRKPMWLKVVVGGMVMRIRNLSIQIQSEKDPTNPKQIKLTTKQPHLIHCGIRDWD